jgi:hypothetical protein
MISSILTGIFRNIVTSEAECVRALREAARELGESPSKAQYEALRVTPSASTILRHCGGWNAAKERAGLETNHSTGSRTEPKPDSVELPDGTEWTALSRNQRWHYTHRELNNRRTLERRHRLRRWLYTHKAESDGCRRCGESDPAVLDFHHRDGVDKEMAVNEMVPSGYSKADIRAEITKCDLLCANCHRKEHHPCPIESTRLDDLFGGSTPETGSITEDDLPDPGTTSLTKAERLRAWTYAYKRDRGCQRCDEDDPTTLQFHHVRGDKDSGVGAMIANSYPEEDVLTEVEKCTVLCANCHRREHYEPPVVEPE